MVGCNAGSAVTARRIKPDTVGVEIGVWRGDSSELFLRRASHLHLVDPWSVLPYAKGDEFPDYASYLSRYSEQVGSEDPAAFQAYYDAVHASVEKRFSGSPVTIHRMQSREFFARFEGPVDWVYIDGLHSYRACLADLEGAKRIVRPGGCIYGDDYGMRNHPRLGGVTRAVEQFAETHGLAVTKLGGLQFEIRV